MMKEAVILAGGFGTRLKSVLSDLPKPMAPVNNRPFLEYILDYLIRSGINKFVLSVGHMHEAVTSHFGNSYKNIPIVYAIEEQALGTGGGIRFALSFTETENVLVLNGDTLFPVDLNVLLDKHMLMQSSFTLAAKKMEDVSRYGTVKIENNRISGFEEKKNRCEQGLINGGVYYIQRDFFTKTNMPEKFSLEKDCLEQFFKTEMICGLAFDDFFLDIGIPEDYEKAASAFERLGF
ncbi:MAG: nucleotidyltransferase family protein [Bacteroidota bacterium]